MAEGPTSAVRAYVKLNRATRAVLEAVEPRVAAAGLTLTQFGVLEAILQKGPMTQRELGRKVLTSAGNMTDLCDKLITRGLIRRDRRDGRSVLIDLTPQGRALIEGLFPCHAQDIQAAFAALSPAEIAELDRLLRKLGHGAAGVDLVADTSQMAP
ncbi:MAG: MarR family transcriptional regulator [Acetobacteraceae bacterium]|nr:MarR family transcriptional regulator [Acetobacteraceae bacterium]